MGFNSRPSGLEVVVLGSGKTHIGVLLPNDENLTFCCQEGVPRAFTYHFFRHSAYDSANPIAFDADKFIDEVIDAAKDRGLKTVIALDSCFGTMLASIVTESLGLPGPSFLSTFVCTNKYYLRRTDSVQSWLNPTEVTKFPVVVKAAEHQFNNGNMLCCNQQELEFALDSNQIMGLLPNAQSSSHDSDADGLIWKRKCFYFKWLGQLNCIEKLGITKPEDVTLAHIEEYIPSLREHQIEVVILGDQRVLVADTGDILKNESNITAFRTPWSLPAENQENCRKWLSTILERVRSLGFKNGTLDIEFLQTAANEFTLVEINCRYSFMGLRQGSARGEIPNHLSGKCSDYAARLEKPDAATKSLRNLLNRTMIALGREPPTLPTRDHKGVALVCAYCYTTQTGALDDILDSKYLSNMQRIKSVSMCEKHTRSQVDEKDKIKFHGYTRLLSVYMALPDDKDTMTSHINNMFHKSVKDQSGLMRVVVDRESTNVATNWLDEKNKTKDPTSMAVCG